MSIFRLLPISFLLFLYGCATAPEQVAPQQAPLKPVETLHSLGKNQPKDFKSLMSPDVLFMLLSAEIAGQRGQYDVSMEGYMEAAKRVRDPRLTERAAMIAMYMKDGNKTNEAVSLWLKQDPQNLTARKISALTALKAEDKQKSVENLSELLKLDPAGFEKTLFELTGALQKESKGTFIYEVMSALEAKHPNQAAIYFVESLLAADLKKYDVANSKIEQALRLQPTWDKALILQAQLAIYSENYPYAEDLLRKASLKYPDNNKFNKTLAQVLIKSAKYEAAVDVFKDLIDANPKDAESRFSLGLLYLQLDKDGKAEDIFKQLVEEAEWRNQASFYLGKIEEKRDNIDRALSWFDKVTDGPFQFESSVTSISLLAKDKQFQRAEQRLTGLIDKFPKQKSRIVMMQAELYSQQQLNDKAMDLLTEELKTNPDQEELLYSRALMADKTGNLELAEQDLKKILAKSPDNVEALNALGYSLADKTTRYAEAQTYLLHALRFKPDEAVILDSYGWLKFKMGDKQTALNYLQRAYNKQPENEIAAHLAEVLWEMGKQEEARKLITKALENAPNDIYLLNFKNKFLSNTN